MLNRLRLRLRALFRKGEMERELDEELRFHLEKEVEQNLARGMGPEEARLAALRSFGGVEQVKEESRDVRGVRFLEELGQDLRYGARMLVKNPGFTVVAVIMLALGIGANTAIFSVVNAVLLRPLDYEDPDRLVTVLENNWQKGWTRFAVAPGNFAAWREQNQVFEQMAAFTGSSFTLVGEGEPEQLPGTRASANLFALLGVKPALGRDFLPEEDHPGGERVVIVSHRLWQRRFGADPGLVGKPLTLNGQSYTVVGVMPAGFLFPNPRTELWVPVAFSAGDLGNRGGHDYVAIARLKPGVTLEQAQTEMSAIAARLEEQYPETNAAWGARVTLLVEEVVGDVRPALLALVCAVAFVLLIACANVANLLLARAAARQKEVAIRAALGSSRSRLLRQLLTESVLLSLLGGAFGMLLAAWGVDALVSLGPANIPRLSQVGIDGRVLGFAFLISLATGIIFGLAPALQASQTDLSESLKEGGRSSSAGAGSQRLRRLLVVAEVALALALLVGAGLMIKSFVRLSEVETGFDSQNVLTAQITLPQSRYDDRQQQAAFFRQVLARIEALPGVESVGAASPLPFTGDRLYSFIVEGHPTDNVPSANYYAVSPDYFVTMGIPLLKGRFFTEADMAESPRVAIINETMARRYFPDEDPIGKRMNITNGPEVMREIVGVVGDVKQYGLDTQSPAQMYEPYLQRPYPGMTLVVRAASEPAGLIDAVRREVLAVDKEQPIARAQTMEEIIAKSVAPRRFSVILLAAFAAVALTLAAVGIYGVMSYLISQRTHEIGVRMALGAGRRDVLRLVVGQGMRLALLGVGIGLLAAFALTRLMESLLFGVSATDPLTYIVVALLLATSALLACYVPARRATKVDPLLALRYE
ncbi:MAG TPA: ABC transporter permease [Blastocatellia bacterium]|nr:ABC transporter permease [Blastocatellia bacterium]